MKTPYKILITLIVLGLYACQSEKQETPEPMAAKEENTIVISKVQFERNQYQLTQPESLAFSEEVVVNGMIDVPPENRAVVNAYFEGYVSETHLLIGDEVNKGDLLIKLKHPDFVKVQEAYVDALANLDFQTAEYNRKSNLWEENIIAEKVFQKTKNDYLSAKARLSSAKEQLLLMNLNPKSVAQGNFSSEISVYAPIDGKISKIDVSQGKFVAQSDRIMEIVNIDHVHLELNVYEKDLPKIKVGQKFQFSLPEASSDRHPAFVKLIGAEIDPENRFIKVHAHPDEEDKNYVVGMYVTAYFQVNSTQSPALPETAFTELDGKTYSLKLIQQTDSTYVFKKQLVKSGAPENGYKPLLNTKTDQSTQFLANGVFDILSGD